MSVISRDLLLSDSRQALLAPRVLLKLRLSSVDYSSYLHLLSQDVAEGLSPSEWGDLLANQGILSIAKEFWFMAELAQPEIDEKYQAAKASWGKKTAELTQSFQHLLQEYKGQLEQNIREHCEALLREVQRYVEQEWFDLAQEALEKIRTHLDPALTKIEEERKKARVQLLQSRDELLSKLAGLDSFPSGDEGEKAAHRLLTTAGQMLEQPKWDARRIQKIIDLARSLCDGAVFDSRAVARVLGEKYDYPKATLSAEEDELPLTVEEILEIVYGHTYIDSARSNVSVNEPPQLEEAAQRPKAPFEGKPPDFTDIKLTSSQQQVHNERTQQSERLEKSGNEQRINKNFALAERLFKEALQLWSGNGAAAKNLATMLNELDRTKEAILVLEQGVEYAQERLPFYNLLVNFCKDIGEFDKGREYAHKALRLCGDARAEIGVLDSLIQLEVKAGNIVQAIEHCDTVLRLNPSHEHYRRKRERLRATLMGQSTPLSESRVQQAAELIIAPFGEDSPFLLEDLEIAEPAVEVSPLLVEDLEKCELTKVNPTILKTTDLNKIVEEADRLTQTGVNWDTRQPKERADYFLQAAKIVIQILGTGEIKDQIAKNLKTYLNNYTGAMGEYFLSRGRMDSARAYFLEHVRLFEHGLPWYTLYRIANYFQTFVPHEEDMVKLVRGVIRGSSPRETHALRSVQSLLNRTLAVVQEEERLDFGRGIVEIACMSPAIYEPILQSIKSQSTSASILWDIFQRVAHEYSLTVITEMTSDLFSQMVDHRSVSIERQEDRLRQVMEAISDKRRLPESDTLLQSMTTFQVEWNSTDRMLFARVREICREAMRYFEESRFEDKDYLARSVSLSAERFLKQLDDMPTYMGRAYFARIVYRFRRLVEEEHRKLRLVSLPELVPTVVKTAWLIKEEQRTCHIEIANKGESGAQDVRLRVLESEAGDYVDDLKLYLVPGGSIYARPHSVTVDIPVTLQNRAVASKDAVDLRVKLEYYDRENTKKETDPIRLRLSLRDEVQFSPIENLYQAGPPVESHMFIGRDQLMDELVAEITQPDRTSAVVIYGQKRSGKTSILRNLKNKTPDWIIPVYFSMQTFLMEEDIVPGMFYLIASEIAYACSERGLGDKVSELTWEQLKSPPGSSLQFRAYLNSIRHLPNIRLVLLIDEFTELAKKIDESKVDPGIMKYLKSLIEQRFFSCIISGVDSMPQVLKRYSNELAVSDPRVVGYLKHDAAAELIERPIRLPDGRSRFTSSQVVDEIIRLTAGSPYYIQIICQRLVEYLNSTYSPTVTGADIDHVVASLIQGPKQLDPFTKFDNLFRYKGDETQDTRETTIEGLFLYLLADETRTRPFAPFTAVQQRAPFVNETELLNLAEQLEERQVIERASGPIRQYRIVVDLFRRWINVNRPTDTEALNKFRRKLERMNV